MADATIALTVSLQPTPRAPSRWSWLARAALTALSGAATLVSIVAYLDWRATQDELIGTARSLGTLDRRPETETLVGRRVHGSDARTTLARILLSEELDRRWLEDLSAERRSEEIERGLLRLEAAASLARDALAVQPSAWLAHTVAGGANFLLYSRRGDRRVVSQPESWYAHLQVARQLAPSHPDPTRLLAAAQLGNWARLSRRERADARRLLQEAFRNPTTLGLFFEPWLRVAPSLEVALSLVPDTAVSWRVVRDIFHRRSDLERLHAATLRLRAVEPEQLDADLTRGESMIATGEPTKGSAVLRAVGRALRPSRQHADRLERVVLKLPPGTVGEFDQRWLSPWLDWVADQCLWLECPIAPSAIERMAGWALNLQPEREAELSVWATERPARVEVDPREPRSGPTWSRYRLAAARRMAEAGNSAAAHALLRRVSSDWASSLPAARARAALGLEPERTTGTGPIFPAWTRTGDRHLLPVRVAAGDAQLLEIAVGAGAPGALVEILVDGELSATELVFPGGSIAPVLPEEPGHHLLELRSIAGSDLRPVTKAEVEGAAEARREPTRSG